MTAMDPNFRRADVTEPAVLLALAACLLGILGAKLWLIAHYAVAMPFWDQWDSEGAGLYKPYLTGTLKLSDLIGPHSEHRILFTRLIGLGLLQANGFWDPLAQMIVNAVLHTATIGLVIVTLTHALDAASRVALFVFALVINAVPFGSENTLWGFQTQFYLLPLFGFLGLFLLRDAPAGSARWWLGTLIAVASYFTAASGALTLAAAIAVALAQCFTGSRRGWRELAGVTLHAVLTLAMIMDVPSVPGHAVLKATSVEQFLVALVTAAGWPLVTLGWASGLRAAAVVLINLPLMLTAIRLMIERPAIDDRRWLYLGAGAWVGLQVVSLAYGRATGVWAPRYFDIFTLGLVVNAVCLLHLQLTARPARMRLAMLATAIWFGVVLSGAGQKALNRVTAELAVKRAMSLTQQTNLMNYLATGDFAHLSNKAPFDIPHPSAEFLRDIVTDPVIRAILPPSLFGKSDQSRFDAVALRQGPSLIPIGLALLLLALLALGRPTKPR